ncbi:MAG: PAS domain S-box protein [Desulfomonilia bacterium]|jgi:PAS domain S-box-containing protein
MSMTRKILVVEDDPVFRNYLHQVLKYDFDVVTVPGPLEALEALRRESFALMITDLRMPDMDGRTLVEKARAEIDPNLMVIVITAFEDDWPVDIAMSSDVFRYLRKGAFLPSELKQNVSKALEVHGSIVSLEQYKRRADISETLYRDVFDKSADALFITDITLKPIAVNRRFTELSGYSLDDLKDKALFDLIEERDRQQAVQAFNAQIAGRPPGTIRLHFIRKDGSTSCIKVWARVVRGLENLSSAVFCMAREDEAGDGKAKSRGHAAIARLEERLASREREIENLKRQLQRLTDHAKGIVIWLGRDFRCEYMNAEVKRLLGYSPEDYLGQKIPWERFLHEDDLHLVKGWKQAVRDRVPSLEGEVRVYTALRYMLFLSYRVSFAYDADGAFDGLDIIAEDITQQKIAEQELRKANEKVQEFKARLTGGVGRKIKALKESEERYKQIVEDSGDIIFSLDTEARMVYMNARGLETLGLTHGEVYLRPCREFLADEASEKILEDMIGLIREGRSPSPFDLSIETSRGTRIYRTTLARIGEPPRIEFVCIARDISEEIEKSKRLQLLANIEHYSADAIIGLDTDRTIISWNHGATMMFGWSEDEAVGKPALLIIPDEEIAEADRMIEEVRRTGMVRDLEVPRKTKDGRIIDVLITITAMKDKVGRIYGFSAIIKDLTEKKKMEAALIQSERLAATGKLSASIAHEINNPLYGIRSCLNHVLGAKKDGIDYQFVRLAIKETDRIADLIRNMKTFYQPDEGRVQKVDLSETLREVFILNRKYLEDHSVKLRFKPDGAFFVECIPDQIKQVFINIINNAVEAMPEGGELRVSIRNDREAEAVSISFEDDGVGIASDDLPRVFDMFYSKKTSVKGVGLGMSVIYGIVKRHGGSIDVASEEGKGSTFTVTLPVRSLWARQMHLDLE